MRSKSPVFSMGFKSLAFLNKGFLGPAVLQVKYGCKTQENQTYGSLLESVWASRKQTFLKGNSSTIWGKIGN